MTPDTPPLDELLRRTAAEIRACRTVVVRLEDAVHALIDGAGPRAPGGPLADLQAIDLLDQRLADLALWTDALAAASEGLLSGHPADALGEGLLLAEMRRALAGHGAGQDACGSGIGDAGHAQGHAPASGHAEFF